MQPLKVVAALICYRLCSQTDQPLRDQVLQERVEPVQVRMITAMDTIEDSLNIFHCTLGEPNKMRAPRFAAEGVIPKPSSNIAPCVAQRAMYIPGSDLIVQCAVVFSKQTHLDMLAILENLSGTR